jgi:hypothetical protein
MAVFVEEKRVEAAFLQRFAELGGSDSFIRHKGRDTDPHSVSEPCRLCCGRPEWAGYAYSVSIMEFADGRVVHETQYFANAFGASEWRTARAEPMPGRKIARA